MRLVLLILLLTSACQDSPQEGQEEDFRPLFDGHSLDGWRGLGTDLPPEGHWRVDDGTLRKVASSSVQRAADGQVLEGGDLITIERFGNFELRFEWRVASGANSGVKYNVDESMSTANPPASGALGFEYQVLDDSLHSDNAIDSHRTGSLYDLVAAPDNKPLLPVGQFNRSRIVWIAGHGEHWLNGQLLLEFDLGTPAFDDRFAASKYAGIPEMNLVRRGHIVLQDHGDDVWYRNIRIRTL